MSSIIRGQAVSSEEALAALPGLSAVLEGDLITREITPELVIAACDRLARGLDRMVLAALLEAGGMDRPQAEAAVAETVEALSRPSLERKLRRELGEAPFTPVEAEPGIVEVYQPLGVLTHIAAGNAAGLPAMSVLEGLLAGNINLLKLPGGDDGLSTRLLLMLLAEERRLEPYVYVFDLPSSDVDSIKALIQVSDAVAVWGSDAAISGIRALTPPFTPVIEWGHRLSFGYVTAAGESVQALMGLAEDICTTEQLLCSAPQCVFYESQSCEELLAFARRFARVLAECSTRYRPAEIGIHAQAEITSTIALAGMEEVLGEKAVLRDGSLDWSVLVDFTDEMKPAPLYRNVWVKPIVRGALLRALRPYRGYLQTVGLACSAGEQEELAALLVMCGITRVAQCGGMSMGYAGEPHDGSYALRRYVRRVSLRR